MRQQNGKPPATSVRKPLGERAHKRISMSTEYQEKFLPPRCHASMVTSAPQKAPYHTLKGTSSDKGSLIRVYVTHKYTHHPPQQSLPPKVQRRCSSAPQNPARSIANQVAAMFYTSVYKDDFQAWKVTKRQPYKLTDSLKVHQGLVAPISTSKQSPFQKVHGAQSKAVPKELEPQPIESITSYRSDYVVHPVQPRKRREQPVQQNKGLPLQAAVPLYRELFDAAHKSFENGSPETQFQDRGKAKESIPSADVNQFISTTHADFPAHKCQRTKPILPSGEHRERANEPFESTTTMREAYKAWDTPRCRPEQARPKKATFSLITHQPIDSCNTNQKPFSLNPKVSDTEGGKSTEKPPRSAEDGGSPSLDRTSPDTEESRTYQKSFGDKAVNWFDGGICESSPEESSEEHHIYSYTVSTKS